MLNKHFKKQNFCVTLHLSMVAHICHGTTKNFTSKTKTSRQNQKPHGKTKNLTAKTKYLTAKPKTSRQKQNTSRLNQIFHSKTKIALVLPWGFFVFAVRFSVLPWGILFLPWGCWFWSDSCGPPYTSYMLILSQSFELENGVKMTPKRRSFLSALLFLYNSTFAY